VRVAEIIEGDALRFGSLFSGIGGFELGFERAGMRCSWQVERDGACRKFLRQTFHRRVLKDVRYARRSNLAHVDLICGGFPCQDLSVAGRRAGLAGKRSGLWWEFHRILGELAPRWCVVENVPGLLSSNGGRDFAVIVRGLVELGYGVAWRILDAQHFGVPQRRRRVFIVGHLGDGRTAQVLFEPESVRRHPAARGAARARLGPSLANRARGGGGLGTYADCGGGLIASPVTASAGHHGHSRARGDGADNLAYTLNGSPRGTGPNSGNGWNSTLPIGPMPPLQAGSSTERGNGNLYVVPDVAWALQERDAKGPDSDTKDGHLIVAPTLRVGGRDKGAGDSSDNTPLVAGTLRSHPRPGSNSSTEVIAGGFDPRNVTSGVNRTRFLDGESPTLHAGGMSVAGSVGVRRLTPTECERLQGFPDGWTLGHANWKLSDSRRYQMLGNAVAVPVVEWLGRRILEVEARERIRADAPLLQTPTPQS